MKQRLKNVWIRMIDRCTNKNHVHYKDYGGRGISVCKEWLIFDNFYNDMAETYIKGLSLDRIKNNKGYYKKNCRWATSREQALNRRSNRIIDMDGIKMTFVEFSEKYKINPTTIYQRLSRGWGIEKAIKTPARFRRKILRVKI